MASLREETMPHRTVYLTLLKDFLIDDTSNILKSFDLLKFLAHTRKFRFVSQIK